MKNRWRILGAMTVLTLVLSACGTPATKEKEPEKPEETTVSEVEELEKVEEIEEVEKPEDLEETDDVVIQDPVEQDKVDEDKIKEEPVKSEKPTETTTDFSNEATLVKSDEQAFSMYVLPSYKLTSEEPGRDVLYSVTDESVFMRVETLPKEDGSYDYLDENMLTILNASSAGDTPVQLSEADTLPSGDGITNVKAYTVKSETGPVTGIIFERGNLIVRLTIFDSAEAKHYKELLQMGETITSN